MSILMKPDAAALRGEVSRSAGIDNLRGLCVLLVVLHHIHLRFKLNGFAVDGLLPASAGEVVFWSGYLAVITFFVVSGFLITGLSLRRWGSLGRIDLRDFYQLRLARIAPCLLLLVLILSLLHLLQVRGFVINPERSSLGRAVLAALTFHVNWLEGHHGYLPGCWDILWSLSVEEVFYLIFPIVCLSCRSGRWLLLPLIGLIAWGPYNRVALAGQDPWQDYAYLSCADAIAFGCIAALVTSRIRFARGTLRLMMTTGVLAVIFIEVSRGRVALGALNERGLGVSVLEIGIALILVGISQGVGRGFLMRGTGLIRTVGRASYEIYLTHMLVVLGLMPVIAASSRNEAMIVAWYVLLLLSSVTLGWAVYIIYSEPMNGRLRHVPEERG